MSGTESDHERERAAGEARKWVIGVIVVLLIIVVFAARNLMA